MEQIATLNSSDILSLLAIIISGFFGGYEIFSIWYDLKPSAKLKIRGKFLDNNALLLYFTVRNAGKRSLTLSHATFFIEFFDEEHVINMVDTNLLDYLTLYEIAKIGAGVVKFSPRETENNFNFLTL